MENCKRKQNLKCEAEVLVASGGEEINERKEASLKEHRAPGKHEKSKNN